VDPLRRLIFHGECLAGRSHRFAGTSAIASIFLSVALASGNPYVHRFNIPQQLFCVTPRRRHVPVNRPQHPAMYSPVVGKRVTQTSHAAFLKNSLVNLADVRERAMKRSRVSLGALIPLTFGVLFLEAALQSASAGCQLNSPGGQIKHVVHLVFDNVHLRRDNPNVPSDLEQMPNLLNFIQSNGTISGNHHTPLISHTATDILTA
jgi:hypothetical protein